MYHVLKDFAGPVATIIAATVAVFFTWRLGRGQLQIARRQADTALDQLRYNLFEKRYGGDEAGRPTLLATSQRLEPTGKKRPLQRRAGCTASDAFSLRVAGLTNPAQRHRRPRRPGSRCGHQ
jgi:hypothetical protein